LLTQRKPHYEICKLLHSTTTLCKETGGYRRGINSAL
jgi:hypothetical protein